MMSVEYSYATVHTSTQSQSMLCHVYLLVFQVSPIPQMVLEALCFPVVRLCVRAFPAEVILCLTAVKFWFHLYLSLAKSFLIVSVS